MRATSIRVDLNTATTPQARKDVFLAMFLATAKRLIVGFCIRRGYSLTSIPLEIKVQNAHIRGNAL